jgi:hypothetical protein
MSAGNERRDRYELSRRNTLLVGTADAALSALAQMLARPCQPPRRLPHLT